MKRFLPYLLSALLVLSLVPSAPAATKKSADTTTTEKTPAKSSATTAKAPAKSKPATKTTRKDLPEPPAAADERGVPMVTAGSAIVVDAATGNVLHAVNADQR